MTAEVIRHGLLDMKVCAPEDWSDERIKTFAEASNPCGTENGWHIRRDGDPALAGAPERVKCSDRPGHVHIMLDA